MIIISKKTRLIFFSLLVFSFCTNNFNQPQISETQISVKVSNSVVSQMDPILKMSIQVTNNSQYTIAVLDTGWISTTQEWNVQIFDNDSTRYYEPVFIKRRIPSSNDYVLIDPLKTLSFSYNIDFSEITSDYKTFGINKSGKSTFKIKVVYKDKFLKHDNALSNKISSNETKIIYKN